MCTEPTAAWPTAPARAPPGDPPNAPSSARHVADRAAIEPLLRGRDLLGLQDVELDDVLRGLELAHAEHLARRLRIAEVVGKLELLEDRPEIRAFEHLEVGDDSSTSAKSAMLFDANFCRNVALLLLISPGMTMSAGPFLLAFMYSTGL